MFDDKHTTTIPASADAAATIREMYAAAARLRAFLDAPPAAADWSGVAFLEIYAGACRVRDAVDADTSSQAAAIVVAVGEVRRATLHEASDDSDGVTNDALRRMVREALNVLDEEVLPGLRAAVLAARWRRWLRELHHDATCHDEIARAIAANVIVSAGEPALYDAMAVRTGGAFTWQLAADDIILAQRCARHNEYCCLSCPDDPAAPIPQIAQVEQLPAWHARSAG
jgi:hypothetical protein